MKKILFADIAAVFILSFVFFKHFTTNVVSDIQLHSYAVFQINSGESEYPANFLYYFFLNLFSVFSDDVYYIISVSVVILAFSVTAKYLTNLYVIGTFTARKNSINVILSLGLILAFAIQDPVGAFVLRYYYFGKTVPNVWHNSTIIFLMPFAILLFWMQYEILSGSKKTTPKIIIMLTALSLLNVLIKPSFFFVYAPVTLIFVIMKEKNLKKILSGSLPVLAGCTVLFIQFLSLYIFETGDYNQSQSSIALAKPFEIWTFFVPGWYLPISFVHSYAFPIVYLIFYGKEAFKKSVLIKYAVALTVTGLLISIFVKEDGPRFFHGNFMWQNVVCLYILMMSCALEMVKRFYAGGWKDIKFRLTTIVFFWHVASGILYFFVIFLINPA